MLGGFQVMTLQEFITNKIINPIKSMGKSFSSYKPKDSTAAGSLISLIGILAPILLYIPIKMGIIAGDRFSAYAQQQQQSIVSDPLSDSLQIAQSKVQAATSPGAFGHGVPSLYNLSTQDLLMILGITGAGCILAYAIVRILLTRTGFKEKEKIVMHQQQQQQQQ
jgi:hypothetical protein